MLLSGSECSDIACTMPCLSFMQPIVAAAQSLRTEFLIARKRELDGPAQIGLWCLIRAENRCDAGDKVQHGEIALPTT